MNKYQENEGVWKTIAGRRVFIRNGQSLQEAIDSSGKFDDIKQKLIKFTNENIEVILMHIDDIQSIKRVIQSTKLKIAEVEILTHYSTQEIRAIKKELWMKKISYLIGQEVYKRFLIIYRNMIYVQFL